MVAVKIIEHSADINSKIEGFRENVVSSNIQHPNVVSCQLICEHMKSPVMLLHYRPVSYFTSAGRIIPA